MVKNKAKRKERQSSNSTNSSSKSPIEKKTRKNTNTEDEDEDEGEVFQALDMAAEMSSNMKVILEKLGKLDKMENTLARISENIESIESRFSNLDKRVDAIEERQQRIEAATTDLEEQERDRCTETNQCGEDIFDLRKKIDYLEAYSRRENLIFTGIPLVDHENTEEVVRQVLKEKLQMSNVDSIEFQRIHRLGKSRNSTKPIIARFLRYQDTVEVLKHAYRLKGSNMSVFKDFPKAIQATRKKLLPKFKQAKQEGKSAYFSKSKPDELYIDGQVVSLFFWFLDLKLKT